MPKKEAVLEAPEVVESVEPKQYHMPPIHVGDPCVFYPYGRDNEKERYAASVTRVGQRAIELVCQYGHSSLAQFEVHHISDPDLAWNTEYRKRGAWEYSDVAVRLKELEDRIETLESALK